MVEEKNSDEMAPQNNRGCNKSYIETGKKRYTYNIYISNDVVP